MKQSAPAPTRLRKGVLAIEFKDAEKGTFRTTIASFGTGPDKQGDVYTGADAFPIGKAVVISAYGHTSWYGELPVGDGTVAADEKGAYIDGQFWLDTASGKEHYLAAKRLAEKGLGDWSYGYDALSYSTDPKELAAYGEGAFRILKELDVFEGSMVLVGAGNDTGIDTIKSALSERIEKVVSDVEGIRDHLKTRRELRAKEGRTLSAATRDRIAGVLTSLQELLDASDAETDEAEPADSEKAIDVDELRAIQLGLEKSHFERIAV